MERCFGCMENKSNNENCCSYCGYIAGTKPRELYHLKPGYILNNRYTIGRVLGHGGFGVTYIGWDCTLEQKVAIKEYLPADFSTRAPEQDLLSIYPGEKSKQFELGLIGFVDEAKKLAKFNDISGVVEIKDTFITNSTAYIVMEYLNGVTAESEIKTLGKIPYPRVQNIILQVLRTLEQIHPSGIIHRDISPANIFLLDGDHVKLLDFGSARYASTYHSKSLSVILKPGFAPEEQYRSRGNQGPWSDVYAIAASMYKMLTGTTPPEALERLAHDSIRLPSKCGVQIDQNIENALMNALNLDINERTKSASAFISELESESPVERIYAPKEKDSAKRGRFFIKSGLCLTAIILILAPILIFSGVLNPESFGWAAQLPDGMLNAPGIVNRDIKEAEQLINEQNLQLRIVDKQPNKKAKEDTVVLQSPQPGALVYYESVIDAVVSSGWAEIYIPDVCYFSQDVAQRMLEDAGFTVKLIYQKSSSFAAGTVLSQSPDPGTAVEPESVVTLTISKSDEQESDEDSNKMVTIPNVQGMLFEKATEELRKAGLFPIIDKKIYNADIPENTIITQNPGPDEKIKIGSNISLGVSHTDPQIRIPDVQYKHQTTAKSMLEELGVHVTIRYEKNQIVAGNHVISQSIPAGTSEKRGVSIELIVCQKNELNIPNVSGSIAEEAKKLLSANGFNVLTTEEYSDSIPIGTVIYQIPAGNSKAEEGSSVTIIISKGISADRKKVKIPNVKGLEENAALAELRRSGFNPRITQEYNDVFSSGIVIQQTPQSGEQLSGAYVDLVISKGPKEVNIPDFTGLTESRAIQRAQEAGLVLSVSQREESFAVPSGVIVRQNPSKGMIAPGSTISVVVSNGTNQILIPDFESKDAAGAINALEKLKIKVKTEYQFSDKIEHGNVVRQDKKGYNPQDVQVTLIISKGTADSGWLDGEGNIIDTSKYTVQTRFVYRSRKKEFKQFSEKQAQNSDWQFSGEKHEWGEWVEFGEKKPPTKLDREIIQEEKPEEFHLEYQYYRYRNGGSISPSAQDGGEYQSIRTQSILPNSGQINQVNTYSANGEIWFRANDYPDVSDTRPAGERIFENKVVDSPATTVYLYRDAIHTYTYFRWGTWSAWTSEEIKEIKDMQVESKEQYKYSGK